jgi:hypothetical protein
MYSPHLQHDQIHQLWLLAKLRKRPVRKVLKAILKEYFDAHQEDLATAETVTSPERTTGETLPVENGNVHGGRT